MPPKKSKTPSRSKSAPPKQPVPFTDDTTRETFLPKGRFEATKVEDALAEPLEDVTGIRELTGDLARQWERDHTGSIRYSRKK